MNASPNFDKRPPRTPIDMLVIHYTGMETAEAALERLCDPSAKVSAHYVIDEDGAVIPLVEEDKRAWHAGVAFWRGQTDINARSIGIELVNPGHEFGYRDFTDFQMAALETLAADILSRHDIPARNVVGHSDVAPARKTDPGERFDWYRLANAKIGLFPTGPGTFKENGPSVPDMLKEIGYETSNITAAVTAFQRHFRPETIDGTIDGETTSLMKRMLELVAEPFHT
ncbi:MAG: N-acetylmuramoyl-L-alanine amidase [Proteobacteria bacterium]|nr:N-acetylmuramoyl-L-alanine amidase [Pseudomonadota bacterium]MDA1023035.1 N-acetylmuramoyl-L-alanine amidase [Pseudomonadota bacterium]